MKERCQHSADIDQVDKFGQLRIYYMEKNSFLVEQIENPERAR